MVSPHPTLPIICTPRAIRWLRRAAITILLAPVLLIAAIVGAGAGRGGTATRRARRRDRHHRLALGLRAQILVRRRPAGRRRGRAAARREGQPARHAAPRAAVQGGGLR